MRVSSRLLAQARQQTSQQKKKAAELRSLIELYHASAEFPTAENLRNKIDWELLHKPTQTRQRAQLIPALISAERLDREKNASVTLAQARADIDQLAMNKQKELEFVPNKIKPRIEDAAFTSASLTPAQRQRMIKIVDALQGTSDLTNAGLAVIKERADKL